MADIGDGALTETDDAAPVVLLTNASTKSNPNDTPDRYTKNITIKYSEDISGSTSNKDEFTVLNTADAAVTISASSETTDTLTLTLDQADTDNNTDQMSVTYSGTSIVDAVSLAAAAFADTALTDAVAPFVVTKTYKDNGANGSVDRLELVFSEVVTWNGSDLTQVAVTANNLTAFAGNPSAISGSGTNTLTLTMTATTNLTGVGSGTQPTYTYTQSGTADNRVKDNAASPNDWATIADQNIADGAVPVKVSMQMKDADTDGKVDVVEVTYSEDLAATTATAPWTVEGIPSAGSFTSVSEASGVISLNITEGAGTEDTSVGSLTVALDNTAEIADAAANAAADFSAVAPTDAAAPVILAAYAGDKGATPGAINEAGDVYKLIFSEALAVPTDTEASHETDFIFGGGATDTDNIPTKNGGGTRVARDTTNAANDTLIYSYVADDSANVNLITPGTHTIDVNVGSVAANSIEDAAGNDMVDTNTHSALTLTSLDVEPPAFVSAEATDNTHIAITFAENITVVGTPTWGTAITGTGIVATAGSAAGAVLTVTVNALNNTAFTAADLTIAADTVEDATGNNNELLSGNAIDDGQLPAFVSAAATSDTNIRVTFSETLASVANAGGSDFTVSGATVTAAGLNADTTKVDLTVDSLSDTAFTSSDLDIAASAVADSATNNNALTENQSVTDSQAPTFVSAVATSNTNIRMTFSEQITVTTANGSDFTSTGADFTATAAVINADTTKVDLTVNALNNTAFTSSDLDIAADAVKDVSAATNGIAQDLNNSVTDGQVPVISTATLKDRDADGKVDAVDIVFSEPITDATFDATNWTIGGSVVTDYITTVGANADANDENIQVQYDTDDLAVNTAADAAQVVFTDGDSITDAASNYLAANASITEIDGAAPVPVSAASNRAIISGDLPSGTVITVTFSESITVTPGSIDVADAGDDDAGNDTSVYFNPTGAASDYVIANLTDETARFTDGGGTTMVITSDGATSITWTTSAEFNLNSATVPAIVDAAANAAVPASADIVVSGLLDTTPPTVSAAYTLDQDGDGKIDGASIVFNESMDSSRTSVSGIAVTGYTVSGATGAWSTTVATDDTFTFNLTENTYDTDAVPAVGYTNPGDPTGVQDLSGNDLVSYAPAAIVDAAKPVIVSISTMDDDSNGKIDMIKATISEDVSDASFDNTKDSITTLTLSGTLAAPTSETDTANDNVIYIGITEGAANSGDVGNYTADATLIDDLASSPNAMAAIVDGTVVETDGAKPVLISAASTNILQAGNIKDASTVTLTFSENVVASSATFTMKVSRDGVESVQTYTNAASVFDGSTVAIGNDAGGDTALTLTATGATTGNDASTYSMGSSQTQGYWTNGATLYVSAATGIVDEASVPNNLNVVPTTGVSISAEDGTAPTAVAMYAYDDGVGDGSASDGQIDRVVIYFNEALEDGGNIDETDITALTVHNGDGAQDLSNDIALAEVKYASGENKNNCLEIILDGSHEVGTGVLTITYNDGGDANSTSIRDVSSANNLWSNSVAKTQADITSVTDAVKPVIASTDINDSDADGYLNELVITYSETIAPSSVWTSGDWTITDGNGSTNLVTGATGADSGRVFTITLADTAGSTAAPTFVYTAGTSITDGTNTALSSGSVTPTDDVAPALMSAAPSSATTITAVFSEPLLDSSVQRTDFDISSIEGNITSATLSSNSVAIKVPVNAWTLVGQTFSLLVGQSVTDAIPNTLSGLKTKTIGSASASLVSIDVTPNTPTIRKADTLQFVATGTYSDDSTADITASVTWTSSKPTVATINATGEATGVLENQSTVITASLSGVSGTETLTVSNVTLSSITIEALTPDNTASLPIGDFQTFKATGVYSDTSQKNITSEVIWISSATSVASFDNDAGTLSAGVLEAEAAGTADITATLGGKTSNTVSVTVTGASATPTVITPATAVYVTTTSYTITGTSAANANIYIYSYPGASNWFYATADGSGDWTATVDLNSNQDNNFRAYAVESGKASSGVATVPTITQDGQGPNVIITSPTGGNTSDTTPLLAYEVDAGLTIVVKVDGTPVATRTGESLAELAAGSHVVAVYATDAAGNTGSASVNFTVDQSVPGLLDANYPSGVYNAAITVLITNGGNGTVYYTTDGTTPDTASTVYTSAGIDVTGDTTVKVRAMGQNNVLGPVSTFTYVIKTDLDGTATQDIVLKNGEWNIFSTPKLVDSFTADTTPAQTTLTGLVSKLGASGAAYIIEGGTWKSLIAGAVASSTHAHYQLEVPQPLYGYVFYNSSGADITVTITYETGVTQQNSLFDRTLSAGWNSVGVADYQGAVEASESTALNADTSDGMGGMAAGVIGYVLDYTANANDSSVEFAATARLRRSGVDLPTLNIINPRETRGYLIFTPQGGNYAGSQYYTEPI
ncbi:MAG: FN3 associated domain-containing protein [Candidatus Paceibacterota bacterium]